MFSVVIPLYNKENSIYATIKSVLDQKFTDFEIIIVDDGSTDKSLSIAMQMNDPRINIYTKKNGGVSSARNFGIHQAHFKWVAFLDADDLWTPEHLEEASYLILQYPEHKVFATSYETDRSMNLPASDNEVEDDERNLRYRVKDYFGEALKGVVIWSSCVIINRSCFSTAGFFNESYTRGEDIDMWSRLARENEIIKSLKKTAVYRLNAENRICNNKYPFSASILSNICLKNMHGNERKYYKMLAVSKLMSCYHSGDFQTAWKIIRKYNFQLLK